MSECIVFEIDDDIFLGEWGLDLLFFGVLVEDILVTMITAEDSFSDNGFLSNDSRTMHEVFEKGVNSFLIITGDFGDERGTWSFGDLGDSIPFPKTKSRCSFVFSLGVSNLLLETLEFGVVTELMLDSIGKDWNKTDEFDSEKQLFFGRDKNKISFFIFSFLNSKLEI